MRAILVLAAVGATLAIVLHTGDGTDATGVDVSSRVAPSYQRDSSGETELARVTRANTNIGTERTEAGSSTDESMAHGRAASKRVASASGFVVPPPTFPASARVRVVAEISIEGEVAQFAEVECDDAKAWHFDELPAVPTRFRAISKGSERVASGRTPWMSLAKVQRTKGLRIDLAEYMIKGRVTDRAGRPIAGLRVLAETTTFDGVEFIANDEFLDELPFVGSPNYAAKTRTAIDVQRIEDSLIQMKEGRPWRQLDVDSLPIQFVNHGVRVVQIDSRDIPLSSIASSPVRGPVSAQDSGQYPEARIAITDSLGRYCMRFDGPAFGSIRTSTLTSQEESARPVYLPGSGDASLSQGQPSVTFDFALAKAASIEGKLERPDGLKDTIHVFAKPARGNATEKGEANAETGEFSFPRLSEGDWLFYARSGGDSGQDYCLHRQVTLGGGGVHRIDAQLKRSCSMTGEVRSTSGEPVAGVTVTAHGTNNANLTREGTTDAHGRFTIAGMYPSTYELIVTDWALPKAVRVNIRGAGTRIHAGVIEAAPLSK